MSILDAEIKTLNCMTEEKINILEVLRESESWPQTGGVVTSRKTLQAHVDTLETIIKEQNQLIKELKEREVSHE